MRLLVVGDPHGRSLRIPKRLSYDAILCPGDFADDRTLRPVIRRAMKKGVSWTNLVDKKKQDDLQKKLISSGKKVIKEFITYNKKVYVVPGNWDVYTTSFDKTYATNKKIINCDAQIVDIGPCIIVGYGKSSGPEYPTTKQTIPMYTKDEITSIVRDYVKTYAKIEKLFEKALQKNKPIIFLSHNVPYHTKLDSIEDNGTAHVGSHVVRKIIDLYQPKIAVCGHVHENQGKLKMKKTICLNAGQVSSRKFFIIDTDTWKIE